MDVLEQKIVSLTQDFETVSELPLVDLTELGCKFNPADSTNSI
jgi:hypothetical protein